MHKIAEARLTDLQSPRCIADMQLGRRRNERLKLAQLHHAHYTCL
jgi:hypothetical protein